MKLTELFNQNPRIIINTDIDGFLCGMILQTYMGCNVVGFSNSKSEVWVSPAIDDIYKPVYIDLYVNRPDVYCIEQHIIAIDDAHHQKIKRYGTKMNPNIDRDNRTFLGDYYHKYPFATVHYLIAKLASEGIFVDLPNLFKTVSASGYNMELGHIILRADDAMFSSLSAYKDNADEWWRWLRRVENAPGSNSAISELIDFISNESAQLAKEKKAEVGVFFKKGLNCDGADGAFTYIAEPSGRIQSRVLNYVAFLKKHFGWELDLPERVTLHQGRFLKRFTNPRTVNEVRSMIEDPSMYSYAFIYGPHSKFQNFSFTTHME